MLCAISLIISGCEPSAPDVPAGLLTSAEAQAAGAPLFVANCAICHGAKADGNGRRHAAMTPPPANLTLPPWSEAANATRMFQAIRHGVPGTAMPSWSTLSDRQIWDVVAYIHALQASSAHD
jgi:high-affinity iron transporter